MLSTCICPLHWLLQLSISLLSSLPLFINVASSLPSCIPSFLLSLTVPIPLPPLKLLLSTPLSLSLDPSLAHFYPPALSQSLVYKSTLSPHHNVYIYLINHHNTPSLPPVYRCKAANSDLLALMWALEILVETLDPSTSGTKAAVHDEILWSAFHILIVLLLDCSPMKFCNFIGHVQGSLSCLNYL